MLKISEFAPYFSKASFDIKTEKKSFHKKNEIEKKKDKNKEYKDYLFYNVYSNIKSIQNISEVLDIYNDRDEKIKIAEQLEKMKFKNKDDIMNNLIYDKKINLMTLNMICKLFNVHLIYIYDNLYINMKYNETKPIIVNYNSKIIDNFNLEQLEDMFEINLEKPLKSVSFYKVNDLQDISKKLNLSYDKLKKQELYDQIKTYLNNRNF